MTKQIVAFRYFAKAPERNWLVVHFYSRKYSGVNYVRSHIFDSRIWELAAIKKNLSCNNKHLIVFTLELTAE
jgi:hypothetical protein